MKRELWFAPDSPPTIDKQPMSIITRHIQLPPAPAQARVADLSGPVADSIIVVDLLVTVLLSIVLVSILLSVIIT